MPKAKAKHAVSALSKAVRTQRHATPTAVDSNKVCLDIRKAATTIEFSAEGTAIDSAKRAPAKSAANTMLAGESAINVDRRIRNAAVPVGVIIDDIANVTTELTIDGFDLSSTAKRLMPRRPAWSYEISSGRLHHREVHAFKQWLADVRQLIEDRGGYPPAFEQNLQVWRQLWRVLERCDVAVVIVDARHPLLHLPPALVYHVVRTLRKPLVIVLNKLDTVTPEDAAQWAACLRCGIPGVSGIVGFSKETLVESEAFGELQVGRTALIDASHRAYAAAHTASAAGDADTELGGSGCDIGSKVDNLAVDTTGLILDKGQIMLGLVGHPNVGKSSVINSLMGGKYVSVKGTPGHTKTLQTLVLNDTTLLCDSPGIVFPRLDVPREAQIIGMLIPLAQVREPFSAIRWVMERVTTPLQELLSLRVPDLRQILDLREAGVEALKLDVSIEENAHIPWSPMLVCAQYALQRGLVKNGRPDCMLAGNEILQRVLDGRVPYRIPPPAVCAPPNGAASAVEGSAADPDSDWQLADEDYESATDEDGAAGARSLFEVFGMEPRGPGSGSIQSRKKQAQRKRREEEEEA